MAYVYRYTDKSDGIIKYVGIVWSKSRTLSQRIAEHSAERKFKGHDWLIEYKDVPDMTRTDAEYMEAHYIALYHTDKYLNSSKGGWGISRLIPADDGQWERYEKSECSDTSKRRRSGQIKNRRYEFTPTSPKETLEWVFNGESLRLTHYFPDDSFGVEFRDDTGSSIRHYPLKGEPVSVCREIVEHQFGMLLDTGNDYYMGLFNKLLSIARGFQ